MFSTNSGEAVPGLAGLAGTIQVTCLILLVAALVVAVAAVIARQKMAQNEKAAGVMMAVANTGMAAAAIAGAGAAFVGGSTLYQVNKVEAQKVESEASAGECYNHRQLGPLGDNRDQIQEMTDWEPPKGASMETVRYWPDPEKDCGDGTADACRMIQITGTKDADGAMGNLTKVGMSEWVEPKGECEDGEREKKEFD